MPLLLQLPLRLVQAGERVGRAVLHQGLYTAKRQRRLIPCACSFATNLAVRSHCAFQVALLLKRVALASESTREHLRYVARAASAPALHMKKRYMHRALKSARAMWPFSTASSQSCEALIPRQSVDAIAGMREMQCAAHLDALVVLALLKQDSRAVGEERNLARVELDGLVVVR